VSGPTGAALTRPGSGVGVRAVEPHINPYLLSFTTEGSSSGSAVAVAANLCAVAVGTEN
jgi:amidase